MADNETADEIFRARPGLLDPARPAWNRALDRRLRAARRAAEQAMAEGGAHHAASSLLTEPEESG